MFIYELCAQFMVCVSRSEDNLHALVCSSRDMGLKDTQVDAEPSCWAEAVYLDVWEFKIWLSSLKLYKKIDI